MEDTSKVDDCMNIFEYIKDDICNQIFLIRENAKKETHTYEGNFKYNKLESYNETQYHNNISILGERGSGKTSLLINLRNYLVRQSEQNSDIVFEIITPDIKDKEDILGWIISLLIKVAKKIKSEKYQTNKLNCSVCKVQTNLDKCIYELKQSYFFRKTIHETIIAKDYSSKIDYLNDNEEKLNADVDIKNKVKALITEMIDTLSEESKDTPLLIFMFDDVDIHSNKINEVLSVIMNYLAHPNIVNLIAGDYKSALENITLKMLEEDNILESGLIDIEINKDDVLKVRKNRAHEFLKKILPPVYRHYIPNLDNKTKYQVVKSYLIDEIKEDEFCKELINKIKEYIYFYRDETKEDSKTSIILYDYMAFLDTSIRGAINVINFIKPRVLDSRFKNLTKEEKFKFLKDLLNVIIVSNKNFTTQEKLITDTINLSQYNHDLSDISNDGLNFNGYINYYAIVDHMNKYFEETKVKYISETKFNTYYNIFMLANIFEIFIISLGLRSNEIENSSIQLDRLHGLNEYISIVNTIRNEDNINLLPNVEEDLDSNKYMKEFICIKQNIFKSLRYNEVQQLFKEKNSGYLESIYIDSFNHKGEVARYIAEIFEKDRDWSKSIIDWIIDNAPSEMIIERKLINNLEKKYGYIIGKKQYSIIDRSNIKMDTDLIKLIGYDIGQSIDDYIKWIMSCRETESSRQKIKRDLDDKKDIIIKVNQELKNIKQEVDIENFLENIDLEYKKITTILNTNENFLKNKINEEAWRRIKKHLIIEDANSINMKNVNLIGDAINIDIKYELKKLGIDSNMVSSKEEYIVIQNNNVDLNMREFVKEYYTRKMINEMINSEHPVIRFKSIKNYLQICTNEYDTIEKEIETLNSRIDSIEKSINKNIIYKYIEIKNIQKKPQYEISNKDISNYIKECIELVISKYENEISKKNKFESLLEYFYEYINDIKIIDKNISELLSPLTVSLSEERIEMYKSEFKQIRDEITIIDINNIINNMKNNEKESITFITSARGYKEESNRKIKPLNPKLEQLNSKLELKRDSINDEIFIMKKDVFQYAFYRILNKYLENTIDYEKEQMIKKVRTEYLIKKREKLEAISQDTDFISLKRYLKLKSN